MPMNHAMLAMKPLARVRRAKLALSRPRDRPRNLDMRLESLPMFALSAFVAGLLAIAPAGHARESSAKSQRPLIVQSHVAAPRSVGAFRLKETTYRPEQKAAGAMFRYAAVPEPELSADVFVYPAGRQPPKSAIKRGMADFRDSLKAAQDADFFRDLRISNEDEFSLTSSADAPKDKRGNDPMASILEADPAGRRIDISMVMSKSNLPLRSRGYLFYKHLYYYKVRVSAPAAAMDADAFNAYADHAARTLVKDIETHNIGGCADTPIYVDKKAKTNAAMVALVTQIAARKQENCRNNISTEDLAKLSQGSEIVTIDYAPDEWSGK